MKLEIILQDLLRKNKLVTVPGFGIFHSKYHPARIIKSDHVKFIPPHTIIEFEATENTNDVSFATTLETEYNIPFAEAVSKIEAFVTQTKEILAQHTSCTIEGIGELYYNTNNEISLKPDSQNTILLDTYGLSSFQVHAIPKEDALERAIRKHTHIAESSQKKILKALFIAIPIIFALILIPNILHIPQSASIISLFRNTEVPFDMSNPHKPIPDMASSYFPETEPSNSVYDTPLGIETPPPKDDVSSLTEISETPPEIPEIQEPTTAEQTTIPLQPTETTEQFYIIVGSFSTEQNATRYAQELQKSSHNAGVVIRDNKIRVYISQSESKDIALSELETIRANPKFSGAWLYAES